VVRAVVYKVAHEIDRLMGFLRFTPDARGRYVARCAPDYFVLPALASHFTRRFGNTPWALIDERRRLALVQEGRGPRLLAAGEGRIWMEAGGEPGFVPRDQDLRSPDPRGLDPWEEIWRSYHRLISIESRKNPRLQRQFVPLRYRKYLPEFRSD
jgi:probable DNA metabolism protein